MAVTLKVFRSLILGSGTLGPVTTVLDTLVDVGDFDSKSLRTKHFTFTAVTNTLRALILGSYDGGLTYPATVEAEFDVTAASQVVKTNTDFYTNIKVQVKPKVAATHGTLTVRVEGASY